MTNVTRRVLICFDHDPMNPRKEFDNVGEMYCWHRRNTLGDHMPSCSPSEQLIALLRMTSDWPLVDKRLERMDAKAEKHSPFPGSAHYAEYWRLHEQARDKYINYYLKRHYVHLPLYLYDHSGLTISDKPFGCTWDSGPVGFIVVSVDKLRKEGLMTPDARLAPKTRKRIENVLRGEIEQYDAYLQGQVYGFKQQVSDDDGDTWVTEDSTWGYYGYDHVKSGLIESIPNDWKNCERVEAAE